MNKFVRCWPALELMKQYLRHIHRQQDNAAIAGISLVLSDDEDPEPDVEMANPEVSEEEDMEMDDNE
jgi:hypothetical protein